MTSEKPSVSASSSNPGLATGGLRVEERSLSARAGDQLLRGLALVAGIGLLIGFFLPWLRMGDLAAVSGLTLMVSSGTVVDVLTGPARGLLIIIPVCGGALVASGLFTPRLAPMAALASGFAIMAFGIFTLARAFIQTVGPGMWLVVGSALLAAAVGIAAWARMRSSRSGPQV